MPDRAPGQSAIAWRRAAASTRATVATTPGPAIASIGRRSRHAGPMWATLTGGPAGTRQWLTRAAMAPIPTRPCNRLRQLLPPLHQRRRLTRRPPNSGKTKAFAPGNAARRACSHPVQSRHPIAGGGIISSGDDGGLGRLRAALRQEAVVNDLTSSLRTWQVAPPIVYLAPDHRGQHRLNPRRISVIVSWLWKTGKPQRSMVFSRVATHRRELMLPANHFFPGCAAPSWPALP